MNRVVEAAKKACCHAFIESLPDGYDTIIGEGGATPLRRRKAADLHCPGHAEDAPSSSFDEATANVDPENEDQLQKAMEALMKDKTILMIAHRLKNRAEGRPDPGAGRRPYRAEGNPRRAGRTGRPVPGFPRRPQRGCRLEAGIKQFTSLQQSKRRRCSKKGRVVFCIPFISAGAGIRA